MANNKKKYVYRSVESRKNDTGSVPYPEFVPTFDHWITMDKQRERVQHIADITEEDE